MFTCIPGRQLSGVVHKIYRIPVVEDFDAGGDGMSRKMGCLIERLAGKLHHMIRRHLLPAGSFT